MTMVRDQQAESAATIEDLHAFARSIGCTVTGDEIVYHTDEQRDELQEWLDENFNAPKRMH